MNDKHAPKQKCPAMTIVPTPFEAEYPEAASYLMKLGEVDTWGFVVAFLRMVDEAETKLLSNPSNAAGALPVSKEPASPAAPCPIKDEGEETEKLRIYTR